MSAPAGRTRCSHIRPDAIVALLDRRPEPRGLFPLADAFDMAARWNA